MHERLWDENSTQTADAAQVKSPRRIQAAGAGCQAASAGSQWQQGRGVCAAVYAGSPALAAGAGRFVGVGNDGQSRQAGWRLTTSKLKR